MLPNINNYIIAMQSSVPASLGVLTLVLLAALGLGRLVDRRNPSKFIQFALGLNLLAVAALLLTFALPTWGWGILLAVLAVFGIMRLAESADDWPLWLIGLGFFAVTMGSAFCPPYAWDEQVYQVGLIVRDIKADAFLFYPDNPYSAFPACGQVLLTLGVKLGGLNFPRLLVAALFVILFLRFYWWLNLFNWRLKYPLLLAFLLSPCILAMNRDVYMEIFIAVNLFAGIEAAVKERKHPLKAALLAGFFAGMAAAVKITAGGAALAILIVFWGMQKARKFKYLGLFIAAGLPGLLFYAKSFLAAGNPVYPFASSWLKPGSADAAVETYHRLLGTHFYGVDGLFGVFTGWFFAIYDEPLFDGIVLGWQFLIVFLAAVAMLKNRRFACFALAGLVIYFYWAVTSQQSRFMLPLLFFAGYFALRFLRRFTPKIQLGIGAALIILSIVSIEIPFVGHYYYCWKFFPWSRQKPAELLKLGGREGDYVAMLDFCQRYIKPGERTMLLFERRTLYFPGDYVLGTPYFQAQFFTPVPDDAGRVYDVLKQNNITYLFIGATGRNPDHLEAYDPENMKLTLLLRQLMRENKLSLVNVPDSGDYNLLRVN